MDPLQVHLNPSILFEAISLSFFIQLWLFRLLIPLFGYYNFHVFLFINLQMNLNSKLLFYIMVNQIIILILYLPNVEIFIRLRLPWVSIYLMEILSFRICLVYWNHRYSNCIMKILNWDCLRYILHSDSISIL